MVKFVLQNDKIVPRDQAVVDIDDRGYQFGDGVYEVVRLYKGRPFMMDEHLARLRRSAGELGIEMQFTDAELKGRLRQLIESTVEDAIIYLQVTRGVHARIQEFTPAELPVQLTAYVRDLPRPVDKMTQGVAVALLPDIRWLRCDIKSLNLVGNILGRQKAKEAGCYEAIQHRDGVVTEGAFSNVFRVAGGTVFTHPEGRYVLSGITRSKVLQLCAEAGIPVREEPFRTEELLAADEVFITSTSNEVMPVVTIDGRPVGVGKAGGVARRLGELYERSFLDEPATCGHPQ